MDIPTHRVLKLLSSMSRLQKRVAMLLAYVAEFGPASEQAMAATFPSGLLGELACAHRHDYVQVMRDGKYSLTAKGEEVVAWLLGNRTNPPLHWSNVARRACTKISK